MPGISEESMLRPALLGLLRLGWVSQMTLADTEVPWYQKRVDLAYMDVRKSSLPVAIELKINSTSRAISQAALNRYLTPDSWAAIWTPPGTSILQKARQEGVGLLLVTESGLYPLVRPRAGEPLIDTLSEHLLKRGRRVRDLLSDAKRNSPHG